MNKNILGNVKLANINHVSPQMQKHLNWVFDLETLDTEESAVVTEISAVAFEIDTGAIVKQCTLHLPVQDQIDAGRTISESTLGFWLRQSKEAQNKLLNSFSEFREDNGLPELESLESQLSNLHLTIRNVSAEWAAKAGTSFSKEPMVWGNGIRFDLIKTSNLFKSVGLDDPWAYWAERDARTLMDLLHHVKSEVTSDFQGTPHYGLDDCFNELRYLVLGYNIIQKLSC